MGTLDQLRQQGYRRRSFKLVDTDEGKGYMDEIVELRLRCLQARTAISRDWTERGLPH